MSVVKDPGVLRRAGFADIAKADFLGLDYTMILQKPSGLFLAGRILLALYFLLPGIMKFVAWDTHIGLMQTHGIGFTGPLLAFSGIAAIAGGLALLCGRHIRIAALGFAAYILIVNVTLHDFWNFEGITAAHEAQNFVKNLGILTACLILAGASPARALFGPDMLRADRAVV